MRTVTALFDTYDHASSAVRALKDAGFSSADVSIVANKMAGDVPEDDMDAGEGAAALRQVVADGLPLQRMQRHGGAERERTERNQADGKAEGATGHEAIHMGGRARGSSCWRVGGPGIGRPNGLAGLNLP